MINNKETSLSKELLNLKEILCPEEDSRIDRILSELKEVFTSIEKGLDDL